MSDRDKRAAERAAKALPVQSIVLRTFRPLDLWFSQDQDLAIGRVLAIRHGTRKPIEVWWEWPYGETSISQHMPGELRRLSKGAL